MVKSKAKMSSLPEMATLWLVRYGTDVIGDQYQQQPVVTIAAIAKAFKLSVAQVNDRLKRHRLSRIVAENPEADDKVGKDEPDLSSVTD